MSGISSKETDDSYLCNKTRSLFISITFISVLILYFMAEQGTRSVLFYYIYHYIIYIIYISLFFSASPYPLTHAAPCDTDTYDTNDHDINDTYGKAGSGSCIKFNISSLIQTLIFFPLLFFN